MRSDMTEATGLVIRSGTIADYEAIQRLCDERYGTNYVNRESISRWTRCPELFLVAEQNGCFAGFSVFVSETVKAVVENMSMPMEDVLSATGGKPPLIYKSAAIVTTYEHRGIMKALLLVHLKKAKDLSFGAVFCSAWVKDGTISMAGVFACLGFEPLYRREMLWYHIKNYVCVACNGACICDAVIYQKKL